MELRKAFDDAPDLRIVWIKAEEQINARTRPQILGHNKTAHTGKLHLHARTGRGLNRQLSRIFEALHRKGRADIRDFDLGDERLIHPVIIGD